MSKITNNFLCIALMSIRIDPATSFAGGFGTSNSNNKVSPSKTLKRKPSFVVEKELMSSGKKQDDDLELDRFGLPPPTIDDIFPPLPDGTEFVPASKPNYSKQEIDQALNGYIPLKLDAFDSQGVEKQTQNEPMRLRLAHVSPPVLIIDNFFTPEECAATESIATGNTGTSKVVEVQSKTFERAISKRTSTSWFAYYHAVPTLLAKTHFRLGIPTEYMEEPQIVRYRTGEEFSWHYDEVPPPQLDNGGQRVMTLLVYLNTVDQGGGTCFRDLKDVNGQPLIVKPSQGSALVFFPARRDGTPDDRTLHKGEIALDEKRIIQMWIHQRKYQAALPPVNRQEDAWDAIRAVGQHLGYYVEK